MSPKLALSLTEKSGKQNKKTFLPCSYSNFKISEVLITNEITSGSIEIEKCGNTENKDEEALLLFELERSSKRSHGLYFWYSRVSCDISAASTLLLLSGQDNGISGKPPLRQSEASTLRARLRLYSDFWALMQAIDYFSA